MYLGELAQELLNVYCLEVSVSTISRTLKAMGMTHKQVATQLLPTRHKLTTK